MDPRPRHNNSSLVNNNAGAVWGQIFNRPVSVASPLCAWGDCSHCGSALVCRRASHLVLHDRDRARGLVPTHIADFNGHYGVFECALGTGPFGATARACTAGSVACGCSAGSVDRQQW
jgi:hypothetical protein